MKNKDCKFDACLSPCLPSQTTVSMRTGPCLQNFLVYSQGLPWHFPWEALSNYLWNELWLSPSFLWEDVCCLLKAKTLLAPFLLLSSQLHQVNSVLLLKGSILKMGWGSEGLEPLENVCKDLYVGYTFGQEHPWLSEEFQKNLWLWRCQGQLMWGISHLVLN